MTLPVRRAAAAAAILVCAACTPVAQARQREPMLRAQIAQATPTPGGEPMISLQPPVALASPAPSAQPGAGLPDTGTDVGLVALAGLSLLGLGVSLRRGLSGGAR